MSLDLDDRQRAMLAEMDVRVWWPQAEPQRDALADIDLAIDPETDIESIADYEHLAWAEDQFHAQSAVPPPAPVPSANRVAGSSARTPASHPQPVVAARPSVLAPMSPGIEAMDWPALQAAVDSCQACAMCLGRRNPVLAALPTAVRAAWLVLGEPPDDAQERAGAPFVDDAGRLLDNMLRAVGVARASAPDVVQAAGAAMADPADPAHTAYLSLVLKCRPAVPTAPDAAALQLCANYLRREIALVQPKVILAMGRLAMQLLLSEDHPQGLKLPLGKLRGQVWHYQGVPVVVTYPPAYLLRNGQDKARAWDDLCLAADVAEGKYQPL